MRLNTLKSLSFVAAAIASASASAASFAMTDLAHGYQGAQITDAAKAEEGKCGEGKCGEGSCGGDADKAAKPATGASTAAPAADAAAPATGVTATADKSAEHACGAP